MVLLQVIERNLQNEPIFDLSKKTRRKLKIEESCKNVDIIGPRGVLYGDSEKNDCSIRTWSAKAWGIFKNFDKFSISKSAAPAPRWGNLNKST